MVEGLDEVADSFEADCRKFYKSGKSAFLRSELSSEVNDILDLDVEETPLRSEHVRKSSKPEKIKCCPTLIGHADLPAGCSRLTNLRSCAALQCRDCDFPVSCFPNNEWDDPIEYLFLRTNMPNLEKISEKLRKKTGVMAYACHCVSYSAKKLQSVHEADLPWFCRGHV